MKIILISLMMFSQVAFAKKSDSDIKVCLASAHVLQKEFFTTRQKYADTIESLRWGNNDCLKFQWTVLEATDSKFKLQITSDNSTWTIDQDKRMVELKAKSSK